MLYAKITRRIRSIVDTVIEVASSNPVTVPCYFIFFNSIFLSIIYLAVACDFQQCGILTCVNADEPVQPPFKLSQNAVWAVAKYSKNIQTTSKGSYQTARMRRLI